MLLASGETLSMIATSVGEINQMSAQIASAAEEQSTVSEEVSRNIVKINDMSAETATGGYSNSSIQSRISKYANTIKKYNGTIQCITISKQSAHL